MNTQGLKDIRGPVALPGDWWWLWLVAGALLIALIAWVARSLICRPQRPEPIAASVPSWEKALAALARLEQSRPQGAEAVKQFYVLLSGIVRSYIEERFNIRAPEMTTEEFMERARTSSGLSEIHQGFLNNFLSVSDMVKFARFEPLAQDRVDALASARCFVEATRPPSLEASA